MPTFAKLINLSGHIMTILFKLTIALLLMILIACNSHSNSGTGNRSVDSITNRTTTRNSVDTPGSFVKNYGANDSNKLFVFVGEKIAVEPLPRKGYSMDNSFKAKYVILKKVYGDFIADTIEFVAYDHYGTPAFSKFKNVLLFVSAYKGTYYHQKYMYNNVYKTKDGRWAGSYTSDYDHEYNKHTKIKPVKIDFAERVAFPTTMVEDDGQQVQYSYPKPYFRTVGDSAIAVYGNYIEELFQLKRDGVLTARGLFGKEELHIK
jgi:hypothetical protein